MRRATLHSIFAYALCGTAGCIAPASKAVVTQARVESTWHAATEFFDQRGRWPQWSELCASGRGDNTCRFLPMDSAFTDGWGRPMEYSLEASGPRISSLGPDGVHGTPDDVTLTSADYRRRVAKAAGCYRVHLNWKDFPGSLILDTTRASGLALTAKPDVKPYWPPRWFPVVRPFAEDSIEVWWMQVDEGVLLHFRVVGDSLVGRATGAHRQSSVVARRVDCSRSSP